MAPRTRRCTSSCRTSTPAEDEPLDEPFDDLVREAQRLARGRSVDELFALIDPAGADTGLAGSQQGDLVMFDLERSRPEAVALVDDFTLTVERLSRFAAPLFLDLGPVREHPRTGEMLEDEAADALWLAYYPFLPGLTARRPAGRMALTTTGLLIVTMAMLRHTEAHLLHRLAAESPAVRPLAREVHTRFEHKVAAALEGFETRCGVENRECGEIDVLATAPGIVLVIEAKNVDLALQKDTGYDHLATTLERARAQVERKARWVAAHSPDVVVVGLIVTRRPVPLPLLGRWPGAVPRELPRLAAHLLGTPAGEWRGDLTAGRVDV